MSAAMATDTRAVAQQRGLAVTAESVYAAPPQSFSPSVGAAIGEAAAALGFSTMKTVSMAGPDAMHMNGMADAGMNFIPCMGGLSHCPRERVAPDDLLRAAQCLLLTLLKLDERAWRR
jgi:N-carbamoyl-L-amino-acid hydrolase